MMIYTSNYVRSKTIKQLYDEQNKHVVFIGVSASIPKWWTSGPHMPELGPTWDILKSYQSGLIDDEEYTARYFKEVIDPIGDIVLNLFTELMQEEGDVFLLCYESPGEFCHRRLLADYFKQSSGTIIPEWQSPKEIATHEQKQRQQQLIDTSLEF